MVRWCWTGLALVGAVLGEEPKPVKVAHADPVAGLWTGTLNTGFQKLRLVVEIKAGGKAADGSIQYRGTLDSVDQGANGIPLDAIAIKGDQLSFAIPSIQGKFSGKRNDKGEYVGSWSQTIIPLSLTLARIDKRPVVTRPQDPKPPLPYREVEVTFKNSAGPKPVKFAGTLTVPLGQGPFPAVVMITGSGAQNRDEELMNHRPFRVIADHLTRQGVAVLRCDDRGVGGSGPASEADTSATFATDIWAAVQFLRTRPEIAAGRIGLVGHSEGGLIAPIVAADHPDEVAFIVLLAGTGISGADILRLQGALIMKASGVDDKTIAGNRKFQDMMFAVMEKETDPAKAAAAIDKGFEDLLPSLPMALRVAFMSKESRAGQVRAMNGAWMRYFVKFDPTTALRRVRCPVLAINGAKDLQVPPKENLSAIKAALAAGGNKDVTTVELPNLNHLFQTCKTGSPAEYATIEETFSPAALKVVSDWIVARTKMK